MRLTRKVMTATLVTGILAVAQSPAFAGDISIQVVQQANGIAAGPIVVDYDAPGAPLLDHFWFRDVNDDQHLLNLTVMPRVRTAGDVLDLAFSDASQNEQFEYRIAHQRLTSPAMIVETFTDVCTGQCERRLTPPSSNVEFVLVGFDFQYTGGDHHMDTIGIRYSRSEGLLRHWFSDQNNDDGYTVEIKYVWAPRTLLRSSATLSGTVTNGTGVVSPGLPSGNKVIRGFYVDGLGGDNHIKRFGFLTNSTDVDIYFGDIGPSDSADWEYRLDYGILN